MSAGRILQPPTEIGAGDDFCALVYRSPGQDPGDLRKVKVVQSEAIRQMVSGSESERQNAVFFSTIGDPKHNHRSLAMLAEAARFEEDMIRLEETRERQERMLYQDIKSRLEKRALRAEQRAKGDLLGVTDDVEFAGRYEQDLRAAAAGSDGGAAVPVPPASARPSAARRLQVATNLEQEQDRIAEVAALCSKNRKAHLAARMEQESRAAS